MGCEAKTGSAAKQTGAGLKETGSRLSRLGVSGVEVWGLGHLGVHGSGDQGFTRFRG